jgi:hypothetical protein
MSLKTYGIIGVIAAGAYGVSEADKSMNYIETSAIVNEVEVDCYAKNSNTKLEVKATGELAYMDCDIAPLIAEAKGMSKNDVKKRAVVTFRYRSPVDNSRQTGKHTISNYKDNYDPGREFKIFAHKEKPKKTRWN